MNSSILCWFYDFVHLKIKLTEYFEQFLHGIFFEFLPFKNIIAVSIFDRIFDCLKRQSQNHRYEKEQHFYDLTYGWFSAAAIKNQIIWSTSETDNLFQHVVGGHFEVSAKAKSGFKNRRKIQLFLISKRSSIFTSIHGRCCTWSWSCFLFGPNNTNWKLFGSYTSIQVKWFKDQVQVENH